MGRFFDASSFWPWLHSWYARLYEKDSSVLSKQIQLFACYCKKWYDTAESVFFNLINIKYVFSGIDSPYIEMSFISTCDHVVTTTGTFIWWFDTSKGTVHFYRKFPKEGS